MSIARIRNGFARRTVLLVAFVPLAVFAVVAAAIDGAWKAIGDALGAFAGAWKGGRRG